MRQKKTRTGSASRPEDEWFCSDPGRIVKHYPRSTAQNHALGLYSQEELRTAEDQPTPPADDALTEEKLQVPPAELDQSFWFFCFK